MGTSKTIVLTATCALCGLVGWLAFNTTAHATRVAPAYAPSRGGITLVDDSDQDKKAWCEEWRQKISAEVRAFNDDCAGVDQDTFDSHACGPRSKAINDEMAEFSQRCE